MQRSFSFVMGLILLIFGSLIFSEACHSLLYNEVFPCTLTVYSTVYEGDYTFTITWLHLFFLSLFFFYLSYSVRIIYLKDLSLFEYLQISIYLSAVSTFIFCQEFPHNLMYGSLILIIHLIIGMKASGKLCLVIKTAYIEVMRKIFIY